MNVLLPLFIFVSFFGCASLRTQSESFECADCRETIVSDFGGVLTLLSPDVSTFEQLRAVPTKIYVDCSFKVLILSGNEDSESFVEDPQLTKEKQDGCREQFLPLARSRGYEIAPAKDFATEYWFLRGEERQIRRDQASLKTLYTPPGKTKTWMSLSRFKGVSKEPFSHEVVEGSATYTEGVRADGKFTLRAQGDRDYSLFGNLSKALLIRAQRVQ